MTRVSDNSLLDFIIPVYFIPNIPSNFPHNLQTYILLPNVKYQSCLNEPIFSETRSLWQSRRLSLCRLSLKQNPSYHPKYICSLSRPSLYVVRIPIQKCPVAISHSVVHRRTAMFVISNTQSRWFISDIYKMNCSSYYGVHLRFETRLSRTSSPPYLIQSNRLTFEWTRQSKG